jgi:signal transduction histidine kinase
MTPEEFSALVSSKRSADRRIASRAIVEDPTIVERAVLEGAYHRESVPQIRQQFAAALEKVNGNISVATEPPAEQARAIYDEAYIKAVRTVSEQVLHQLNPLIGDIEQAAAKEVNNFDGSQIKARIQQMKLQADAITKLYNAAKLAVIEEFDLATVVRNCLPNDLDHGRCQLSFAGPAPMIVQGDRSLITIAVTNGLRNAIEASIPVVSADCEPAIVVNWNTTSRNYWISIVDEGVGFHGNIAGAFEIGASTKGHGGHGLPAMRAAMISLSGSAELIPQRDRGCQVLLSWPIIGAK